MLQSKETAKNGNISSDLKYFLIAVTAGVLIKLLLPAANSLTDKGVTFLSIFAGTIILWIAVNDKTWPSLYAIVTMVLFGVSPANDVFAAAFINNVTLVSVAAFVLAGVLGKTGATAYIAKWILSRRHIKGHPYIFFTFIVLAMFVIATLTSGPAAIIVLIPICHSLLDYIGVKKTDNLYRTSMFMIMWNAALPDLMIPFGKTFSLIILGFIEQFGYILDPLQYLSVSVPICISFAAISLVVARIALKPSVQQFDNYDIEVVKAAIKETPLTKQAKIVIYATVLSFVLLTLQATKLIPLLTDWGAAIIYYIPLVVLCLISIKGKPVLNLREEAASLDVSTLMFLSVVMLFSAYTAHPDFGITTWISTVISPLAKVMSPVGILIVGCFFATVLTNAISNVVSMTLSITIFTPALIALYNEGISGINPVVAIILLGFSANIATLLPSGSVPAAILYGGYLDVKKSALPNIIMIVLGLATMLVVGYFIGHAVVS